MIAQIIVTVLLIGPFAPPAPGTLPWALPSLPTIPTSTTPTIELGELEHSEDFAEQQTLFEETMADWTAPIDNYTSMLETILDETPDATTGDFETGLAPIAAYGTAYDFADEVGDSIGTLFQYMRSMQTFVNDMLGTRTALLMNFLLACAVWLLLVKLFIFAVQFVDMVWSIGTTIWNAFWEAVPG